MQPRKLTDCLTETLKTMENEGSSDEENAELNNKMFVKAASSAGCECIPLTYGYISTLQGYRSVLQGCRSVLQSYRSNYRSVLQDYNLSYKAIDQAMILSCKTTDLSCKVLNLSCCSLVVETKVRVPTPGSVAKYLDDAAYEHEDFTNTSAVTLRARVSCVE